jgi:hypothetical protein
MRNVQVVYGRFTALDTVCKRCGGRGQEEHPLNSVCLFCGGSGVVIETLGRPYTYGAAEDVKVWDHVLVDAAGRSQVATVTSLTSDYAGPVKEAYPLPPTTADCPQCGAEGVPLRMPACPTCLTFVPQELLDRLTEAEGTRGTFRRVGVVREIRAWLEANPA